MNKNIIYTVAGIIVLIIVFFVGKSFGTSIVNYSAGAVSSAVGTSFNSAKVAQINISPTIGATSTGILNTDSFDRIVIGKPYAYCSGVGTSLSAYAGAGLTSLGLTITMSTSTSLAPNTLSANNQTVMILATTTPDSTASTTVGSALSSVWQTGSYWNFAFNATNTAACTVGVPYIGS